MSRPLDQNDVPVFSVRAVREAIAGAVAAERERIRQLAIDTDAAYPCAGCGGHENDWHHFAELLGGES